MLKRSDYLEIIEEIRNTDIKSLDEYIDKVLKPLRFDNENFLEILYKDIYYLIKDIDREGDNEMKFKEGDIVLENGDIALTGYQSRLHNLSIWLHIEITKQFCEKKPEEFIRLMTDFEHNYLGKPNYTPEYKAELDRIKGSLKKERKQNLSDSKNLWNKIFDIDNLELKPNIAGVGINLNEIINKFRL